METQPLFNRDLELIGMRGWFANEADRNDFVRWNGDMVMVDYDNTPNRWYVELRRPGDETTPVMRRT